MCVYDACIDKHMEVYSASSFFGDIFEYLPLYTHHSGGLRTKQQGGCFHCAASSGLHFPGPGADFDFRARGPCLCLCPLCLSVSVIVCVCVTCSSVCLSVCLSVW